MPSNDSDRGYDRLAWFYNRYWGKAYHEMAMSALKRIALPHVPAQARVLDLCCGTGHLTGLLTGLAYRVTGLDGSEPMLRFARRNVPGASFVAADARSFCLRGRFDLVVSTFESLNHIQSLPELCGVFQNVRAVLGKAGCFAFDLLREEAYQAHWHKETSIVEDDSVCILRGSYDPEAKLARALVTMFRREGGWKRSDVTIVERCYPEPRITEELYAAGFSSLGQYDAITDLGLGGDLATGRTFFLATARR